ADVERAHGELRARLADRLGGDHAHRLAHIDRCAAGKIAPVAFGAYPAAGLAGKHGPDAQFLHAGLTNCIDLWFFEQRALSNDHPVRGWMTPVLGRGAPRDSAPGRSHPPATTEH